MTSSTAATVATIADVARALGRPRPAPQVDVELRRDDGAAALDGARSASAPGGAGRRVAAPRCLRCRRVTRVKICGITRLEDAELRRRARRLGARPDPVAAARRAPPTPARGRHRRARCAAGSSSSACSSTPTLDEVAPPVEALGLTHVQLHGDEGPAFCAEVARRTGAQGHQGRARRRRAPTSSALERFHTDFHLLDAAAGGLRGGTGGRSTGRSPRGAARKVPADPVRRPDARRTSPTGIAARAPVRGRRRRGIEAAPGRQGPATRCAAFLAPPRRQPVRAGSERRRRAPLRPLRRPVRPRDADAGAGRARGGVARGARRRRATAPSSPGCCATTRAARRRCTSRGGCPRRPGARSGSSART